MGRVHVVTACIAIVLGIAVLIRRKGDGWHRSVGYLYIAAIIVVNFSALGRVDDSGRPGPFHALAIISIVTTALGWRSLKFRSRRNRNLEAHASFMTWSVIGVVTAGLAQAGNLQWTRYSPWPVMLVIPVATAAGLACVPRFVSHQFRR